MELDFLIDYKSECVPVEVKAKNDAVTILEDIVQTFVVRDFIADDHVIVLVNESDAFANAQDISSPSENCQALLY